MSLTLRAATADDVGAIHGLMRELAVFEKLLDIFEATPESVHEALFGNAPAAECLIAQWDGQVVGYALYFHNFSTFLGRRGLYLEDVYVQPSMRGKGVGQALLRALARIAVERNCARFEWTVLDWNQPAIDFYASQGATVLPDWRVVRMTGEALERFAGGGNA
ncbi:MULTISPECIES: GNAT family N-acetyltransferase [Pandoraea]|jgi:GNAT superfamily N-acetyltransferase|uniref:GCN5 family acetyltransferase n=1 Tax=Pandoraea pnomenusa TaxID=93220 RepID=A0A378YK02_9BURK|nr:MULTISPECIES: GNAT family N-acetyltransferase [Pandoraea]AHB75067.1 GNAT family N-acetyltransferase [Pandoraea pnomenusa]AHN76562.1 GCN5 family acetyltransferase [Pandoraea pnomenusa]AIM43908.1 GCN5 family acetyltransferase [Pandoraea pnomenusa 3kgm]AIU26824.1 GCN5 family acetyltransferase [Pandoraea pnomenusa]ANC44051.1 GCN5 family acetyltransferase [Pandoraea pnomenusa]